MKKILIPILLLTVLSLITSACSSNNKKNTSNKLLIEYTKSPQEMANSTYIIQIYANRKVKYGNKENKDYMTVDIEEKLFNHVLEIAYSKNINKLNGKDISDKKVLDGYLTYITIYNEKENKEIKIGGSNPKNKYFNELERLLSSCVKEIK